ncbi:hypothetical protein PaeCFBP13512_18830 [Paenibacillus sp. CFBP13512]|uniref:hypothetical protein n=1 Tax=Paenibacillus sp. CFBP13512 TaxID=2184007 RepID=UPI0010BFE3E0|nr:hypothetical protein [Paenibacillus sp. CFBP13512]TKJ87277.1 hypothetical protein PaeCFBP13512_18830 [Paenibacillus sp. CFBP13512]
MNRFKQFKWSDASVDKIIARIQYTLLTLQDLSAATYDINVQHKHLPTSKEIESLFDMNWSTFIKTYIPKPSAGDIEAFLLPNLVYELKRLDSNNCDYYQRYRNKEQPALNYLIYMLDMDWNQILKECERIKIKLNIPPNTKKWTNETMIDHVLQLHAKGIRLTMNNLIDSGLSQAHVKIHFRTLNRLITAANLKPSRVYPNK